MWKMTFFEPNSNTGRKKKTIEVPSIDLLFLWLWCQLLEARKSRENYRQPSRGLAHSPSWLLQTQKLPPKSMLLHNLRRNGSGPPCGQQGTEHQCSLFLYVQRTTHYTASMSLPMAMVTRITVSSPDLPLNQTPWPGYFSHALSLDPVRILQSSGKQSMCLIF